VMQIAPSELNAMSLWEFAAMVQGWNKANAPAGTPEELKPEDEDGLSAFIDEKPIWVN
jgi:hypothetical protein